MAGNIIAILFMILAVITLAGFGLVVFWGAPFLPTRRLQMQQALDLLDVKAGDAFYDLGCGDGRLLRAAALRGAKAVGWELNPFLFALGWLAIKLSGSSARIKWGNFWQADIADADAVFVFLITKYMGRLNNFMKHQKFNQPVRLVSYAFEIPGQKPVKKAEPMFLYKY